MDLQTPGMAYCTLQMLSVQAVSCHNLSQLHFELICNLLRIASWAGCPEPHRRKRLKVLPRTLATSAS